MNSLDPKTPPKMLFGEPNICTYCGQPSNCIDHVIPFSYYSVVVSKRARDSTGIRTFSCNMCNGILGDRFFDTFLDRIKFVNATWIQKGQKYARSASWSDQEIADLDHTLRTYVASQTYKIRFYDSVAEWPFSSGFWFAIDNLKSSNVLDREHPKYSEFAASFFKGFY